MKYATTYIIFADNKAWRRCIYLRRNECHETLSGAMCVCVVFVVVRQHKIHFINLVPNLNLQKHVYHIYTAHVISMAIKIFVRPTSMAPSHHFAPADSYEFQAINIINVSLFQPHALFLPLQIEHVTLNDNIVSISFVLLKGCVAA